MLKHLKTKLFKKVKINKAYGADNLLNKFTIVMNHPYFVLSYLQGRAQCVQLRSAISSTQPIINGVPQGSILGTLLFITFMNGLI